MTIPLFGAPPALPTSRPFDPFNASVAPDVTTQHKAQTRGGITMEQALAQAEHLAKQAEVKEDPDYREAADWLRGKSSQRILIEIVCRIMKLEKADACK